MLNLEKIGNKIAILRKQKKMKQIDLANALYVTHQAVSKWENGKSIPSIEILYDLTELFNVSIDYLLQNADIPDDDYETLLHNFPRTSVIKAVLEKKNLSIELSKCFYLLSRKERKSIIEQIVNKKLRVNLEKIWYILSIQEREYILVVILSGKFKYDMDKLYYVLSIDERNLTQFHMRNGTINLTPKK